MPATSESNRGGAFSFDSLAANRIWTSRRILVSCAGAHHQCTTFRKGSGFRIRVALCQGEIRGSKSTSILTGDPNNPKDGQKNHTALRPCGSRQNTVRNALVERYEFKVIKTRKLIESLVQVPNERGALQKAGEQLDQETQGQWVAKALAREVSRLPDNCSVLVDSIRIEQ